MTTKWNVGDWARYGNAEVKIIAQMGDFDLYRIDGPIGKTVRHETKDVTSAELSSIPYPVGTLCWYEGEKMEVTQIMWSHSRALAWVDNPRKRPPTYGTFAFLSQLSLKDPNEPPSYESLKAENETLRCRVVELEAELKEVTGRRDWLEEAYETVTGGTNPL